MYLLECIEVKVYRKKDISEYDLIYFFKSHDFLIEARYCITKIFNKKFK